MKPPEQQSPWLSPDTHLQESLEKAAKLEEKPDWTSWDPSILAQPADTREAPSTQVKHELLACGERGGKTPKAETAAELNCIIEPRRSQTRTQFRFHATTTKALSQVMRGGRENWVRDSGLQVTILLLLRRPGPKSL